MSRAPACPECGSRKVWKDGLRYLKDGSIIQRYICRECGYRFSDPSKSLKSCSAETSISNACQERALLAEVIEKEKWAAGATVKPEVKGEILTFLWQLKKDGKSKETIQTYSRALQKLIENGADLDSPDSVKESLPK